jgi:transposase-like protein
MARRRKPMSEGKKNIIAGLLQEYDIKSAEDIQDALKDLLGETIQSMLEAEMDDHLGYAPYERAANTNSRNGTKS